MIDPEEQEELNTFIREIDYEEFQAILESEKHDSYAESISYMLESGQKSDYALKCLRKDYNTLPYPTLNTELSTDTLMYFWKCIELHATEYEAITEEGLKDLPLHKWPAVPIGTFGPLLLLGHCCPPPKNTWGIDRDLCPCYWISPVIYISYLRQILRFLEMHEVRPLTYRLPPKPLAELKSELDKDDEDAMLFSVLEWLTTALPLNEDDRNAIEDSIEDEILSLPSGYLMAIEFILHQKPLIDIRDVEVRNQFYERVPRVLVDRYKTLCFLETESEVYIALPSSSDYECEDQIINRLKLDKELVLVQTRSNDLISRLENLETLSSLIGVVDEDSEEAQERALKQTVADVNLNEELVRSINPKSINTSPDQLLQWTLFNSIVSKASDIHVEQYKEQTRVRARIDGQLNTIYTGAIRTLMPLVSIVKNHCNMTLNNNNAQDGRFSIKFAGRVIDARVSAIPWRRRFQKLTIRLLDKTSNMKSLEDMGMHSSQLKIMTNAITRPQGMIVVTGPTGSGKSTTLYAALQAVNNNTINVQTIEDPIEYEMEGINQTQVDRNQDLTFSSVLRRILRADPDVIMVGEIRDRETAIVAAEAALTGHLILSTLHSLDAVRAIGRMLSMGVPPYMLADSLIMLHAQRLLRRLCRCRKEIRMSKEVEEVYRINGFFDENPTMSKNTYVRHGCPECFNLGYRGRLAIMELCPVDDHLRDLIADSKTHEHYLKAALNAGYEPMFKIALRKAIGGATSVEESLKLQRF